MSAARIRAALLGALMLPFALAFQAGILFVVAAQFFGGRTALALA